MSTIQADIEARLAEVGARRRGAARRGRRQATSCASSSTIRNGVTLDLCERVTKQLPEVREQYALEVSSPGTERPLTKPEHFRRYVGRRARVRTRGDHDGRRSFTGELLDATDDDGHRRRRHRRRVDRLRRHPPFEPRGRLRSMSAEIVEAVKALGREKGISEEKLMGALEDALLSAYKKQPGAARYARVRMDRDSGDFIVEEFLLPDDLEDQLLDEAEEQATGALERRVDPETGEVIIPEAPGHRSRRA